MVVLKMAEVKKVAEEGVGTFQLVGNWVKCWHPGNRMGGYQHLCLRWKLRCQWCLRNDGHGPMGLRRMYCGIQN